MKILISVTSSGIFLTCLFLGGLVCYCESQDSEVIFVTPPKNVTVCKDHHVTISCGYRSNNSLPIVWIINGIPYNESEFRYIVSTRYHLNSRRYPEAYSLTIDPIRRTGTIQCGIKIAPNITIYSKLATITAVEPFVEITSIIIGCGEVYATWINVNNASCTVYFDIELTWDHDYIQFSRGIYTPRNSGNFTSVDYNVTCNLTLYGSEESNHGIPVSNVYHTLIKTPVLTTPTPLMVKADFNLDTTVITVSWQAPLCTGNVSTIMYNITVMDQYSPAIITVPADVSSVEISQLPGNGTRIVANKDYTITVSAITNGSTYTSDPVVVETYILYNCKAYSPSAGTIRVSCDSSHQILVTLTCTDNCSNPLFITYGYSPLIIRMLDTEIIYTVVVNVFDGNEMVLRNQTYMRPVLVQGDIMSSSSSGSSCNNVPVGGIIGGIVGGVAAIIFIIFIVIICCIVYRKKNSTYDDDDKASLQRSPMLQTSKSY